MTRQVFVSHDESDLDIVESVLSSIQYLPFELSIAISEAKTGRIPATVMQQISNSDIFIPVLTQTSKNNQWVNQEIGYAVHQNLTIIPLFEDDSMLKGLIGDYKGVELKQHNEDRTTFDIIRMLRQECEPMYYGPLMPNWYVRLQCNYDDCRHKNNFEIDRNQSQLWQMYEDNINICWECVNCGREYHFNPATFEFEGRTEDT